MKLDLNLSVNGKPHTLAVATSTTLAEFLREDLRLTGCRVACDGELCGACTVLLDGRPVAACSTFAFQADGSRIETIEGLSNGGRDLHPI